MILGNWLAMFEARLKFSRFSRRSLRRRPLVRRRPAGYGLVAAETLELRQLLAAAVTGVTPNSAGTQGGTSVQIAGSGFTNVTAVMFGNVAASSYMVMSGNSIMATSPMHSAGIVDIIVATMSGNSTPTSADQFTYQQSGGNSTPPSLVNLRLSNDTGVPGDYITTDAHVAGTLVTSGSMSGLTVQFDFDGNNTVDATAVQVNPDGSFNFDVGNPGNGTPGIPYGNVSLHARGVQTISGQTLTGTWQTLTFSYQAPPPPAPAVSNVHLVNDTQAPNDLITSDARIAGGTSFNGSLSGLTIQVDTDHNGTSDLTTTTAPDGTFLIDIARQGSSGPGITYGPANIQVRAGSGGNYGSWQTFTFTFQAPPVRPSVASLTLVNDTGTPGDFITTDPRITAHFSDSDSTVAGLTVQIDYNGDGVYEATATTDQNGNFTFDPRLTYGATPPLAYGNRTLSVRAGEMDNYTYQMAYGAWGNISFTYNQAPVPPQVANLHLANDTGTAADGITADATVAGSLTSIAGATGLTVEFDYNGDGTSEVAIVPNSDGSFSLDMGQAHGSTPAVAYGNITVKVRVGEDQSGSSGKLYGDWQTLSFVYAQYPPGGPQSTFSIGQMRLLYDTGTDGDLVTSDPRVTGYVTGTADAGNLPVDFDLNGDGVADGSTTTTVGETFVIDLQNAGLAAGAVALKVRARQTDAGGVTTTTPWATFNFTYAPQAGPVVGNLHLVHDTGVAGDLITSIPQVAGTLTMNGTPLGEATVQYAWTTNDQPAGTIFTANDGTFTVDLSSDPNFAAGPVTVYFRGATSATASQQAVFGAWQVFHFTDAPTVVAAPTIQNLHLVNDTSNSTNPATHDPRVAGSVVNGGGPVNKLPVQYDVDGDGNPDGIVYTDADGNFLVDPRNADIPDGPTTIRVRSYTYDDDTLQYVYSNWVSLTFTYAWARRLRRRFRTCGSSTMTAPAPPTALPPIRASAANWSAVNSPSGSSPWNTMRTATKRPTAPSSATIRGIFS